MECEYQGECNCNFSCFPECSVKSIFKERDEAEIQLRDCMQQLDESNCGNVEWSLKYQQLEKERNELQEQLDAERYESSTLKCRLCKATNLVDTLINSRYYAQKELQKLYKILMGLDV